MVFLQGKTSLVSRQILRLKSRSCFKNHPRSHKGAKKVSCHAKKMNFFLIVASSKKSPNLQ